MIKDEYNVYNDLVNFKTKFYSKKDFNDILQYLRRKEEKYLSEIISALNIIHHTNLSELFWRKTLSMGFRRYIHITYDEYLEHKNNFSKSNIFHKMNQEDYKIIENFDDFRDYFTNNICGYNQMFSLFIDCFHEELNPKKKYNCKTNNELLKDSVLKIVKRKLKNITFDKLINLLLKYLYITEEPTILIMGSYFKPSYLKPLLVKSNGSIKSQDFNIQKINSNTNEELRKEFQNLVSNNIEDKFDKFFYHSLFYNFPKFIIEDFKYNYNFCNLFLNKHKKLKYIISEDWIGNSNRAFFLAVAKEEYNIKHVYNEHNALFHHILGGSKRLQCELVDIYYSLGWEGKGIKKGASLYDFNLNENYNNQYSILYISCTTFLKRSEFNAHYTFSAEAAHLHIKFSYDFFNNISKSSLSNLVYRAHPIVPGWKGLNKEKVLDKFLQNVYLIDEFKYSSKIMMKKSRLVIIDYISTGYLESLIMNIPTIAFWDQRTYFLNDEYSDFFDVLVSCGICQTSPTEAANFVNDLVENDSIEKWWYSEQTQNARKAFLDRNIGDPEDAINFYLSLARE